MRVPPEGGVLMARIHQLAGRIFAAKLKKYQIDGINPAQGRILMALWKGDGISMSEIGTRTDLQKSTLTSMIDRMERDGLVMRAPCGRDRREILIYLTTDQAGMRDSFTAVSKEMNQLFYKGFSDEEIDRFEEGLRRILHNLQEES